MLFNLVFTLLSVVTSKSRLLFTHWSRLSPAVVTCQCGPGVDPVECGKAAGLRAQSHIGIPRACFNRPDPGPCTQDLIRIYYDHKTYQCKWFSFSGKTIMILFEYLSCTIIGCGGNANRFVSIKNCYKLCHPYYRQRFISLNVPQDGSTESEPEGDDDSAAGGKERSTTEEEEETTTPTTTTEEFEATGISFFGQDLDLEGGKDAGKVFFKSSNGQKEEIQPEVHVVHE